MPLNHQSLAILWDMDGTLIDTKTCHYITWRDVFNKHGYELAPDVFESHFGRNNTTAVPLFLGFDPGPEVLKEWIKEKEAYFREIAPTETHLMPGVETWLKTAQNLGFRQAIASSGPIENIELMVKVFGITSYFDALVSGSDLPAKPEPAVFLKAAQGVEILPERCLVVEDSVAGVNAAKRAGMKCIAVTSTHPREKLTSADAIVDDFTSPLEDYLNLLFPEG